MEGGKVISDNNEGDYDTIKKPKKETTTINSNIKIGDELDKELEEKPIYDKELEELDKKILEKFINAKINSVDLILNLTENDLNNLKITDKEREKLESFLKEYLNNKESKKNGKK